MQRIVFDEPYRFVPPVYSLWWPRVLRYYLPRYIRKAHGVHSFEYRNVEHFRELRAAGHSIVLAPNHCRMADPLVLGMLALQADCYLFAMASWHLFKQGRFQSFMIRRMGAFSLFREGNDRQAIDTAIDILVDRTRPLIMFPEGALTRHNDLIEEMMEGPSFIARQAAKRLKKEGKNAEVMILPVAIRYAFEGDLNASLAPVLEEFEQRLAWQPQTHLSLVERISKIGQGLLALKEVEFFGAPRNGNVYERAEGLVAELLARLEADWKIKDTSGSVIARTKRVRTAIVGDMMGRQLSHDERESRWRDLAAAYYAQQMSHYPRDYILREKNLPERVVETVERFEEDFTDAIRVHEPFHCVLQVGKAIPVGTQRIRDPIEDPVMADVRRQLQSMISGLAAERTPV